MSALQLAAVVLGDRRQYGRLLLRELRDALASCQRTITAHVFGHVFLCSSCWLRATWNLCSVSFGEHGKGAPDGAHVLVSNRRYLPPRLFMIVTLKIRDKELFVLIV